MVFSSCPICWGILSYLLGYEVGLLLGKCAEGGKEFPIRIIVLHAIFRYEGLFGSGRGSGVGIAHC